MSSPMQPGVFSWCELMTTDPKGAEAFYSKLFGWTMMDGPVEGMEYRVISAGSQRIGGLMNLPPTLQNVPPHWGAYVTVEDVEETAKLAETLGGKVLMQPHNIPTVGRMTVIQDPQGAVISAITYAKCDQQFSLWNEFTGFQRFSDFPTVAQSSSRESSRTPHFHNENC